jgi:hypothetical protein
MPWHKAGNPMKVESFKYYMHDGPATFRFELAGHITSDGARQLEQDWRTASSVIGDRTLVVDLSFVSGIDEAARDLMVRWHNQGARFVAKPAMSRSLVESITGKAPAPAAPRYEASMPWFSLRAAPPLIALLVLLLPAPVWAAPPSIVQTVSAPSLALSRYLVSLGQSDPFHESSVDIYAALPGSDKRGHMHAIRREGYQAVQIEGDSTVKHQVIARYLDAELQARALPPSSVAITPANYRFRYAGSISSDESTVYVFEINPKKKRAGLMRGQVWIDGETGLVVRQSGRLVKSPSIFLRRIDITRDTTLRNGFPASRTTHLIVNTRLFGQAELTIAERPLDRSGEAVLIGEGGRP